jgi:hypothetical protein
MLKLYGLQPNNQLAAFYSSYNLLLQCQCVIAHRLPFIRVHDGLLHCKPNRLPIYGKACLKRLIEGKSLPAVVDAFDAALEVPVAAVSPRPAGHRMTHRSIFIGAAASLIYAPAGKCRSPMRFCANSIESFGFAAAARSAARDRRLWHRSRTTAWRRVREVMAATGIVGAHAIPGVCGMASESTLFRNFSTFQLS